jgi:hypothetical protein
LSTLCQQRNQTLRSVTREAGCSAGIEGEWPVVPIPPTDYGDVRFGVANPAA